MKLTNINMENLGLTESFIQESLQYKNLFIGRVSSQYKNMYKVITETGEMNAEISGKFYHNVLDSTQFPAVGDYVMLDRMDDDQGNGIIHHVSQYHISADVAYSFIQYYLVTKDDEFLKEYMAEVLFETARLWADTGHMLNGQFRIDNVTGPDEYTCIVNNNYYTNAMAKNNLLWAAKVYELLKEKDQAALDGLANRLQITETEVNEWRIAGENMYLPYNDELKINAQDDTFLQKEHWDFKNTPKDKYPLLLHYHPLTLYRYQVIKQPDTILAHFLLEDEQDIETMENSYDYYEKITTHDSSLSHCVHSIMASKLGYKEKAYNYFIETARLDLDNTHGNTKDGLHMANMGGTWLAIVYGFAGVRVKESGLYLAPSLPEQWTSLEFKIKYQGRLINVYIDKEIVNYLIVEGEDLTIHHHGESINLESGVKFTIKSN